MFNINISVFDQNLNDCIEKCEGFVVFGDAYSFFFSINEAGTS